jgi:DNA-damage-inducible protein J
MEKAVNINFRTNTEIKQKSEELFNDLGLTMSTAINMFLKQAIINQAIPFDIKRNIPNKDTIEALNEAKAISKDKKSSSYKNMKDVYESLGI